MRSSPPIDRQVIIDGDIARVPLTQGKWALIDKQDVGIACGGLWCFDGLYAACGRARAPRKLYLHRAIMNPPQGMVVDHINGNPLDCRRKNLRICTPQENWLNKSIHPNNTSGFRGVDFNRGKWRARVCRSGKRINIGLFNTAEEAAHAYDKTAKEYLGEFARLNFSLN